MANETKVIEWFTYLKCKECLQFKSLWWDERYKHNEWYMWVLWRCKDCIRRWRKTDHELSMARKRDIYRYNNNPKRREQVFSWSKRRRKEKWYWRIHLACSRIIKSLWIRPKLCSVCWNENKRIEAHHYNYMLPFNVIFCCKVCHSKLDRWIIDYRNCCIVNINPESYISKVQWIEHKINTTWSCY